MCQTLAAERKRNSTSDRGPIAKRASQSKSVFKRLAKRPPFCERSVSLKLAGVKDKKKPCRRKGGQADHK
jgi:hypothetical protein